MILKSFKSFPKIDSHFHSTFYNPIYEKIAKEYNIKLLNINTNANVFPSMEVQETIALEYISKDKNHFSFVASFEMDGWENEGWYKKIFTRIKKSMKNGAVGVKIWKNIGMEIIKSSDKSYLMIDDPFFDPLFNFLSENKVPLLTHLGEPKNCWLPLNEMTTKNDVRYFTRNPQYHMYKHPEFPSYEEQMEARNRMLEKNPDLVFIGCHLASIEWSVDELAKFLDRFPNSAVDLAARTGQLFYQTKANHKKVRDFFIKYQDRILYGTDIGEKEDADGGFKNQNHEIWLSHWEYFVSDNTLSSSLIDGDFKGLKLPKEVVDKIYAKNAKKWYKSFR
jgi:predicted TIM-barrel fold metal-dependent hydrolase